MEISLLNPLKFAIQTWFCNCPQYLGLLRIDVECSPSIHDQGKMLVLPNRLLCWVLPTWGSRFCFFPVNFTSATYIDKNNPFSRCTKRHCQFGIFSQSCFKRIFSNCLPHNGQAKGWLYRLRSRRTTGSSKLDHDFGHLCRARQIQNVWTLRFLEFSTICEYLPFHLGISRYCVCCLSIVIQQSADDIHDPDDCHLRYWRSLFSEYCVRFWIVFYNITTEYNLIFVFFGAFSPTQYFSDDICPLMIQNEL